MAATQLSLYNAALRMCGERKLASLSENVEPRRLLDDIWEDGAIDECLELGQWKFALRTRQITYSPSVSDADFGYRYGFDRPTDLIRTAAISADEYFRMPLTDYRPEGAYWFCDYDTIYVSYVSNDASYGADYSLWPKAFERVVQAFLAKELAPRLKNFSDMDRIENEFKQALADAKAKDAMEGPSRVMPPGTWTRSRTTSYYRRNHE